MTEEIKEHKQKEKAQQNKCCGCGVVMFDNKRILCRRCEEEERVQWCRDYENRYTDSPQRNWMAALIRNKGDLIKGN